MRWVFRLVQYLIQLGFRLWFRLQVHGRENIPKRGKLIFAANHISAIDPFVIGSFVPRSLYFLAKKELFQNPLLAALFRFLQAIPLDRREVSHGMVRRVNQLLAKGEAVLLFPEGTRTRTGQMGEGKSGVGMFAAMNGADIMPVRIEGLSDQPGAFRWGAGVKVFFGPVISVAPFLQNGAASKEMYREIAALVLNRIQAIETAPVL